MSSSGTGRQRHLKRPHCFMCEIVLSASSSSSAASTQQRQRQRKRQRRSVTIHESTTTSVPPRTSTISSSTQVSARSSSTSSRSAASLPSHESSSIQQQRHSATVLVPTPSPPSSSATPPLGSRPSNPSTLPSYTMTPAAAVAGSSMSSSLTILDRASVPSMPPLLAPSAATPADVPLEPSFRDPALAERYWKYDRQKVSLSDAVAAELAFAAAPAFVKRVLGRWEKPPWFWGQKKSVAWLTFITREDIEENTVCAICMEDYRELQPCYILLRCFHFFHKYCFLEWGLHCLVQGKEVRCPLCRSTIPISPISLLHAA